MIHVIQLFYPVLAFDSFDVLLTSHIYNLADNHERGTSISSLLSSSKMKCRCTCILKNCTFLSCNII